MKTKLFFSIIISFSFLFFVANTWSADQNVSNTPSAYMSGLHYVFEPVVDGTIIFHDFVLQNKGTAPLKIEKVKTD
jgi:hypothetical protein